MQTQKAVGIWIRVSTEDQAKGESPENHERRARSYAESKGWTVVELYNLEAVSGKAVMQHAEAKRMMLDIKSGKITGLIFSKLARLARNTKELLEFADFFNLHSADLVSLQESIDTSTPAGRLFYTMIAAMAQWEREEISSRVAASVPIRAQFGKSLGGQATYGYRWKDMGEGKSKGFVIDEQEAPVRKLMYELFLKQRRKSTVAAELNSMGYRTRNGSEFSDTTIMRLLRDTTAKGARVANYTRSLGEGKHWETKPEADWIVTPCPAIVTAELWDECNRILDEQEGKRKKPGPKVSYLFSGYLHCGCGRKMYVYTTAKMYKCKPCRVKIAVDDMEEIFQEQLKSFLLTEHDVQSYLAQSTTMIAEKEAQLRVLLDASEPIQKKMDGLVELRLSGDMPTEDFPRHYQPLRDRLEQIKVQIPEVQAEIDLLRVQSLSSDVFLSDAKNLYQQWGFLPFEEKRTIVEAITEKIILDGEDISIALSYSPTPLPEIGGKSPHNPRDSSMQ